MEKTGQAEKLSLRRIFGLSSIYGITPILDRAMGLLMLPVYTHYLDTTQYGSMVLFYTFAFIVRLAAYMGFPDSLQKLVWDYQGQELKRFLGSIWLFNLGANIIMLSVLAMFSGPISVFLLKNGGLSFLLVLVVINVFLGTQSIIPYVLFRAREQKKQILAYNLTSVLMRVGATVLFLIVLKMGLVAIFLADIAASMAVLVFTLPTVWQSIELRFDFNHIKTIFSLSAYQLVIELFAWVLSLSDRVLIQKLIHSTAEVGIYAVGYTFGSALLFLTKPIQAAWFPYVFSLHSKDKDEYKKQMGTFFSYFYFSCILAFCVLYILSPNFIILLTPIAYHSSINLILFILLGHFFAMIANYFTATFYLTNNLQYVAIVYFATAFINVILNLILIPLLGIYAASMTTFMSYFLMAIMLFVKSQKINKSEINTSFIVKVTFLAFITSFVIGKVQLNNNIVSLAIKGSAVMLIFITMYFFRGNLLRKLLYA